MAGGLLRVSHPTDSSTNSNKCLDLVKSFMTRTQKINSIRYLDEPCDLTPEIKEFIKKQNDKKTPVTIITDIDSNTFDSVHIYYRYYIFLKSSILPEIVYHFFNK